jgi:A/G-specific adenine glycosylase
VADAGAISGAVLAWYDRHRRDLPWRVPPGSRPDPYAVWLSEVMLQQTTVAAVKPYYARFLAAWPTVGALAAASSETVLGAWAGLGYYSRARNLHACAQAVVAQHGGAFPDSEAGLRSLPGVGAYTAAAIAAIAFERRAVVVDGNVERVMARLDAVEIPVPQAKSMLRAAMDSVTPAQRAGDFAQAVMDLGATICSPRKPACVICPVRDACRATRTGSPEAYPRKAAKRPVPTRAGSVFFVQRDGMVLLQTRPPQGLFGGMTELPGTEWRADYDLTVAPTLPDGLCGPVTGLGTVRHGLTHFELSLAVFTAELKSSLSNSQRWVSLEEIAGAGLPTLMRKVVDLALVKIAQEQPPQARPSKSISLPFR